MTLILFISAGILLMLGAPVSVAMGLSSLLTILAAGMKPYIAIQQFFTGVDSTALLAIPFFILAGDLMNKGGLAKRIINFAAIFVSKFTGGMGMVAIVACMLFAAISGSGIATAAAIGGVMTSGFVDNGYKRSYGAAIVGAASPLGIIIPPSIAFIVYGILSKASIGALYKVGIRPVFCWAWRCSLQPISPRKSKDPKISRARVPNRSRESSSIRSWRLERQSSSWVESFSVSSLPLNQRWLRLSTRSSSGSSCSRKSS